MAKTELLMMRDGFCLRPYGDVAGDLFQAITSKRPVVVTVHQARNPLQHDKLWAIATKVADFDSDFSDAEDAVEWAKMHIPSMRRIRVLRDGTALVSTKSISFASMDQISFGRFYDRALYLWAEKIGTDPESLLDEQSEAA